MKKIYLSLLFACIVSGMMSQNFVVADFEATTIGDVVPSLNQWGTADKISSTVEAVIGAETGSLNNSTNAAKVLPIDWNSYLAIDVSLPEGGTASDYNSLNLKIYVESGLTWKDLDVLAKVGDGEIIKISAMPATQFKDPVDKWINMIVPLDPTPLATISGTDFKLIFGLNVNAGTYYVDNVELSYINQTVDETTSDINMQDYDLYTSGSIMPIWSRWGQMDVISAEIDGTPGTGNESAKACKVTLLNYDQFLGFDVVIPEGKTIADYDSVKFKAYVDMTTQIGGADPDASYKDWSVFAKVGSADYFSIATSNPSTGEIDKTWTDINVEIDQTAAAAITGSEFKLIIGFSSPKAHYWVDNVMIKAVTIQTSIDNNVQATTVITQSGTITIKDATGQNIKIINITGAVINNSIATTSSEEINVAPGLYIVSINNKTSKVFVK